MPVSEALTMGLELMLMGMGVVFLLLGLLVFTVQGVSRLVRLLEGAPARPASSAVLATTPPPGQDELVAVISAAVQRYRSRHSGH